MLSPNTFPSHVKPIHRLYPRGSVSKDRAYTKEELHNMIELAIDLTDKVIITVFSSAGFRLEAWNYLEKCEVHKRSCFCS